MTNNVNIFVVLTKYSHNKCLLRVNILWLMNKWSCSVEAKVSIILFGENKSTPPKMDKNRLLSILRYIFIVLNILLILAGITIFIQGNIAFKNQFYETGSFIGGHLVSISVLLIAYGALGAYSAFKEDGLMVEIYASFAVLSLISRLLVWLLAPLHGFEIEVHMYGFVGLEVTIILMSCLMMYYCTWII